jgi:hypothetical protein
MSRTAGAEDIAALLTTKNDESLFVVSTWEEW